MNIKISKNSLPILLIVIIGFLFSIFGMNAVVSKITQKVILEIKRDYAPGPYDPGFDPDKVNPRLFKKSPSMKTTPESPIDSPDTWNDLWENSR